MDDSQRTILTNLMKENARWFKYCVKSFVNVIGSRGNLREIAKKKVYPKRTKFCLQSRIANLTLEDAESHINSLLRKEWKLDGLLPLRLDKDCCLFTKHDNQWFIRIPLRGSPEAKTVRITIPLSIQPKKYYEPLIKFLKEKTPPSKLVKNGKRFELHVTVPINVIQKSAKPNAVCGIDLNMRKIAIVMLTEPEYEIEGKNIIFYNLKPLNQKLNQLGGKKGESQNFMKNEFGNLLKTIFQLTKDYNTSYALEDLTGIRRNSKNMGKDINRWLNSRWAYRKFRTMLEQKAQIRGEATIFVEPSGTSQTCYKCGRKGKRPERWKFTCPHCGNQINADLNAAINIARRALEQTKQQDLMQTPINTPSNQPPDR